MIRLLLGQMAYYFQVQTCCYFQLSGRLNFINFQAGKLRITPPLHHPFFVAAEPSVSKLSDQSARDAGQRHPQRPVGLQVHIMGAVVSKRCLFLKFGDFFKVCHEQNIYPHYISIVLKFIIFNNRSCSVMFLKGFPYST